MLRGAITAPFLCMLLYKILPSKGDSPTVKTQIRQLTVQDQHYVYWHAGGSRLTLNISPKEDKTTKITLLFPATPPEEDRHTAWEFYDISACKNNSQTTIHLGKPGPISEIIHYIEREKPELRLTGKQHTIENAWELLQAMGYSNLEPVWVKRW